MRHHHSNRSAWLLLAGCACLLLTSCTARQSRDQYEQRLSAAAAVRVEVSRAFNAGQLHGRTQHEAAAERVERALRDLDADPPPRSAQDAHDAMVRGMQGLAALLRRVAECEALAAQQQRARCRDQIPPDVFDEIRNDFAEANTIYRQEGFSLPGLDGEEAAGDGRGADPAGGDEL